MREGRWVDSGAYGARTIRRGMALRDQGIPVLPQRAAPEGPRWTAAVGIPRSPRWKGGLPWKDLRWIRAIGAEPPAFP